MPQITGALSWVNAKIETSANGTAWTDISGSANRVSLSGGARQVGQVFTASGDVAIITAGKREPLEVTVDIVYTEGGTDPFEVLRPIYEAGTDYYVRWSPKGGATGNFQYASDAGKIVDPLYPQGDSGSPDPLMFSFKLRTPKVTKSAVP